MNFKKVTFLVLLIIFLSGCKNQFICDYNPDSFIYTDAFSFQSAEYLNVTLKEVIEKIEEFGSDNGYCIANKSKYQKIHKRYLANIRIVKNDITFHIFGYDGFTLHFAEKGSDVNKQKEIKLFCDFLSKEVDINKITYYEDKGKLCLF